MSSNPPAFQTQDSKEVTPNWCGKIGKVGWKTGALVEVTATCKADGTARITDGTLDVLVEMHMRPSRQKLVISLEAKGKDCCAEAGDLMELASKLKKDRQLILLVKPRGDDLLIEQALIENLRLPVNSIADA